MRKVTKYIGDSLHISLPYFGSTINNRTGVLNADILIWIVLFPSWPKKTSMVTSVKTLTMGFPIWPLLEMTHLHLYHEVFLNDDTTKYHYDWISFQFFIDDQFTMKFIYIAKKMWFLNCTNSFRNHLDSFMFFYVLLLRYATHI